MAGSKAWTSNRARARKVNRPLQSWMAKVGGGF